MWKQYRWFVPECIELEHFGPLSKWDRQSLLNAADICPLTNKAPLWNSLSFFLLFNDAPSICWMLTVCLPRIRWSQASYCPIHRTQFLLCIILSAKLLFSIVPVRRQVRRSCWQLRGYILVLFCIILPRCVLFMMYLSFCLWLCCCKSFFILFRPFSYPISIFFLPPIHFSFILFTIYFFFSYWYTALQTTEEVMDS